MTRQFAFRPLSSGAGTPGSPDEPTGGRLRGVQSGPWVVRDSHGPSLFPQTASEHGRNEQFRNQLASSDGEPARRRDPVFGTFLPCGGSQKRSPTCVYSFLVLSLSVPVSSSRFAALDVRRDVRATTHIWAASLDCLSVPGRRVTHRSCPESFGCPGYVCGSHRVQISAGPTQRPCPPFGPMAGARTTGYRDALNEAQEKDEPGEKGLVGGGGNPGRSGFGGGCGLRSRSSFVAVQYLNINIGRSGHMRAAFGRSTRCVRQSTTPCWWSNPSRSGDHDQLGDDDQFGDDDQLGDNDHGAAHDNIDGPLQPDTDSAPSDHNHNRCPPQLQPCGPGIGVESRLSARARSGLHHAGCGAVRPAVLRMPGVHAVSGVPIRRRRSINDVIAGLAGGWSRLGPASPQTARYVWPGSPASLRFRSDRGWSTDSHL